MEQKEQFYQGQQKNKKAQFQSRRSHQNLKRNVTFLEDKGLLASADQQVVDSSMDPSLNNADSLPKQNQAESLLKNNLMNSLGVRQNQSYKDFSEKLQDKEPPNLLRLSSDEDLDEVEEKQQTQKWGQLQAQPGRQELAKRYAVKSSQRIYRKSSDIVDSSKHQSTPFHHSRSFLTGSIGKKNSLQSLSSHIEEFKDLEYYTEGILELKAQAADYYQKGQYELASEHFTQVLDSMHKLTLQFPNEDLLLSTNILLIFREAHLNLALCQIKLSQFQNAIDILSALLYYEPKNVKALYLRGKSYHAIRDFNQSLADFKEAQILKPQEVFQQYIEELEVTLKNIQVRQDDDPIAATLNSVQHKSGRKVVVVKEKRGGLMQDSTDVQKSIDEILNLKKPRSVFSLLRMIVAVARNFTPSLSAANQIVLVVVIVMVSYHYLIKRNLLQFYTFRLLDRIA